MFKELTNKTFYSISNVKKLKELNYNYLLKDKIKVMIIKEKTKIVHCHLKKIVYC